MRKSVVVFGVARGGTSMTCGVVDCLGVNMLSTEPSERQLRHNPKGMFELKFHLGIGETINKAVSTNKNYTKVAQQLRERLQSSFIDWIPPEGDWGFKSPTIHGLEVLLHYIENPHIICVYRNIVNQAKSFQMLRLKNDGVKTPLHDLVFEMANNAADMAVASERLVQAGYPVDYVTYEGLKTDPWREAQRIAAFLGITTNDEMREKVLDFVDPSLHTWKDEGLETLPVEIEI